MKLRFLLAACLLHASSACLAAQSASAEIVFPERVNGFRLTSRKSDVHAGQRRIHVTYESPADGPMFLELLPGSGPRCGEACGVVRADSMVRDFVANVPDAIRFRVFRKFEPAADDTIAPGAEWVAGRRLAARIEQPDGPYRGRIYFYVLPAGRVQMVASTPAAKANGDAADALARELLRVIARGAPARGRR